MARFCSYCGAVMEDTDKVCGQCGTPAMEYYGSDQRESAPRERIQRPRNSRPLGSGQSISIDKAKVNLIIKLAIALVAVIVLGVITYKVITTFTGYNATIRKMVKALEKDDVDTLDALASSVSEEYYTFLYGSDYFEYYEKAVSDALDDFEDSVGNIKSISYEITDVTEISDRRMNDFKDELTESFNMDTDDITDINRVYLKLTVKGKKKSSSFNVDKLYVIKEAGKWKIFYGDLDFK